jgi:hypothetical protein
MASLIARERSGYTCVTAAPLRSAAQKAFQKLLAWEGCTTGGARSELTGVYTRGCVLGRGGCPVSNLVYSPPLVGTCPLPSSWARRAPQKQQKEAQRSSLSTEARGGRSPGVGLRALAVFPRTLALPSCCLDLCFPAHRSCAPDRPRARRVPLRPRQVPPYTCGVKAQPRVV